MKRINKILFILLLMFVYSNVKAEEESYIKVGNIQVTETNQDILGDGTVSYDAETRTLTLNNFEANSDFDWGYLDYSGHRNIIVFYLNHEEGITIELKGNNVINYTGEINLSEKSNEFFVIFSEYKTTIKGDGTLTVNASDSYFDGQDLEEDNHSREMAYYIYSSWNETLTIEGGTFNIKYENGFAGVGFYNEYDINVKNATINMETNNSGETTVLTSDEDLIVENTKINFNSNNDEITYGLWGATSINLLKVDYNFNGKNITGGAMGLYGEGDFIINESNLIINLDGNGGITGLLQEPYKIEPSITMNDSKVIIDINNIEGEYNVSVGINGYTLSVCDSTLKVDLSNNSEDDLAIIANSAVFDKGTYILNNKISLENGISFNEIELEDAFISNESFDNLVEVTDLFDILDANYIVINTEGTFEYLEGKDTTIEKDDTGLLKFRIDGNYYLFKSLKIDGVDYILDTDYTVSEGSTIITLTNDGMTKINALDTITHNVEATFLNGKTSTTTLTLTGTTNPPTMDNLMLIILTTILSLLSLISISLYLNKEANKVNI